MRGIKVFAKAVLPTAAFETLKATRSRRFQMRVLRREGLLEAGARYVERYGCVIRYGPFAGTIYPHTATLNHHAIPKLLGIYEQELHDLISIAAKRKYDLVIDIGSAEGYYAVGLAKKLQTNVLAFDPEPSEKALCREGARLNGVSALVQLKDMFYQSDIEKFKEQRVLCICDCEGFEAEIFTAATVREIANWDLLIELHGNAQERLPRLPWPHKLALVAQTKQRGTYRELEGIGDQSKLTSEYRGPQTWLWCDSQV